MRGYTLIETLIVIAVIGILVGIALPSFSALVADTRRAATVNGLVTALHHARHASVTRARPTRVCPEGGDRCGDDWADGWLVFVEPPGWRTGQPVPEPSVLYRFGAVHGTLTLASNRAAYRFRPFRARSTNGTLLVCPAGRPGRAVVIAPSGRVRTTAEMPHWAPDSCA